MLNTFVLVHGNKVISPPLVTTREYGRWFAECFDSSICDLELYCRSKKSNGEIVLECHPGTKIGKWFDTKNLNKDSLLCWFLPQDSTIMTALQKYNLAELRDAIPVSVNGKRGVNMLRLYTVEQVQFYIQSNVDRKFHIEPYLGTPRQIRVRDSDLDKFTIPKVVTAKKSLF